MINSTFISTQIRYEHIPRALFTEEYIAQCAKLFSENYGVWGPDVSAPLKPGERIKMNSNRFKDQYLFDDSCYGVLAVNDSTVIGQAFYTCFTVEDLGLIKWIIQLVVAKDYRHLKVGSTLCSMAAGIEWKGCGLATSHPYAVRALEKACRIKCDPALILKYGNQILTTSPIPYTKTAVLHCSGNHSYIDTHFFVDHCEISPVLEREVALGRWKLGETLQDGYEFFAFVFNFE
ncbi:unnamed protein product [Didymodactylos carnosus]|uniref:N-acetyltransferase domain-containing protein n=1 Tax=Didymodactylos carnosus TaxID=1234261 RepID=A0A815WF98_9BILA|nr:unnamed protein product [Didymodactylos carnosus]CAF1540110.1 unnamed protein product [Didymodactylos carnosus]CAF4188086.1 unnamed protein product [Didymodactylos carnosus]CAF4400434.1 unnamed protein product [Didymodactylos carnosus]